MPSSKNFTYTLALFKLFGNAMKYRNLRKCRLQVSHVSVIYHHGTHSCIILIQYTRTLYSGTHRKCMGSMAVFAKRPKKSGRNNEVVARRATLCTCSLENNAFSVLHYVIKVTLNYLMLHRFEIHSALELFAHGFIMLSPRSLASPRGYMLVAMIGRKWL